MLERYCSGSDRRSEPRLRVLFRWRYWWDLPQRHSRNFCRGDKLIRRRAQRLTCVQGNCGIWNYLTMCRQKSIKMARTTFWKKKYFTFEVDNKKSGYPPYRPQGSSPAACVWIHLPKYSVCYCNAFTLFSWCRSPLKTACFPYFPSSIQSACVENTCFDRELNKNEIGRCLF